MMCIWSNGLRRQSSRIDRLLLNGTLDHACTFLYPDMRCLHEVLLTSDMIPRDRIKCKQS